MFTNLTWLLHGTRIAETFTLSKESGAPGHAKRVLYQWFTKKQKLFTMIYILLESIGKVENVVKHLFFKISNLSSTSSLIHDIQMGLLIETRNTVVYN